MGKKRLILQLFTTFFKIGLFTFGGGYAMIPVIDSECVEKRKWLTSDDLMSITAIAESTPGPVAINCATSTGYRLAGFLGAASATFGVVLPSFIIIFIISTFFNSLLDNQIIANAFRGIKVAVGVLITSAGIKMLRHIHTESSNRVFSRCVAWLTLAVALVINFLGVDFSSVYLVLISGCAGYAAYLTAKFREAKR